MLMLLPQMTDAMRPNKFTPTKIARVIDIVGNQLREKLEMHILLRRVRKIPQITTLGWPKKKSIILEHLNF